MAFLQPRLLLPACTACYSLSLSATLSLPAAFSACLLLCLPSCPAYFRLRLLCSAEALPFELFEKVMTQFDAAAHPQLSHRPDVIVDDNLGFTKDRTIRWVY